MEILCLSIFIWLALGFFSAEVIGHWRANSGMDYTMGGYSLAVIFGAITFMAIVLITIVDIFDKPIERFRK